ncbi:MAG: hypothetical protein GTN89_00545 [Acidobacteria bacterium]|nr:hypothetical protein [Acidobacteriota bacterium]NIM60274.1 hypothetical protein [Acidobacteriota bacterium]NIO57877.1 hypothetical protein [Acidobacteriota bacterium]NIQ28886.1 hypothetical protein [Acidobacteriota bacterium]NIQ83344.1 hypothetical protein [Acidobacteriota bacterium]
MTRDTHQVELDGLRLIGLGRVPRCSRCPRYADLVERYVNGHAARTRLAEPALDCEHRHCDPLARRYEASAPRIALLDVRAAS